MRYNSSLTPFYDLIDNSLPDSSLYKCLLLFIHDQRLRDIMINPYFIFLVPLYPTKDTLILIFLTPNSYNNYTAQ